MIPGFEEGLVGAKAGEERVVNVTFPEDYQNLDLAGKLPSSPSPSTVLPPLCCQS